MAVSTPNGLAYKITAKQNATAAVDMVATGISVATGVDVSATGQTQLRCDGMPELFMNWII